MPFSEEAVRQEIRRLYETNPHIHMNVSLQKPKLTLKAAPATITGVYPHIFQIEEFTLGYRRKHTLQYTDILLHLISIEELPQEP